MESNRKPRKRDRLISFRRKEQITRPASTTSTPHQTISQQPTPGPLNTESPDRQRTKARYEEALTLLATAMKGREAEWGTFNFPQLDFPQFKGELDDLSPSQFRENLDTIIERNDPKRKTTAWKTCENGLLSLFTAFSPLVKNFLTIAKEGQAVNSFHTFLMSLDTSIESVWIALWGAACFNCCKAIVT